MSQTLRFLARLGLLLFTFQYCQVVQASSGFSGTINLGKAAEGISIQNSPQSYTKTGAAIADLGDVNGDGYSDVGIQSGCYFYVIFGSYSAYARDLSSITPANGFTITGDPLRATCSLSNIGPLGDINADGYADYVVAVSLVRGSIYPAYYVLYGGPVANNIDLGALTSSQGLVIAPSADYADMLTVTSVVPLLKDIESNWFNASDFTRDKEDQLMDFHEELKRKEKKKDPLSVLENRSEQAERVSEESNDDYYYYYYGEDLCPNATVFVYRSEIVPPAKYTSGLSQTYLPVTAAGDLNGDGLEDILVTGEIRADQANFTFFVIYGSASLPSAIYLDQFSYSMGYTLAADEVSFPPLMFTYQYWLNTTTVCSVNQTTGITTRIDIDYQYNYTTTFHAATFSGAGDMNGDGYADLVLGSSYASNYAGQAFVVYGSGQTYNSSIVLSQMTSQQGYRIYGAGKWIYPNYGDRIGFDVSGNFDFNGDGYRDIIVGAPRTNNLYGSAYVIYGTSSQRKQIYLAMLQSSQGIALFSSQYSRFGNAVSTASDFNNDGYDDVIIGAPYAAGGAGAAYVIFGGENLVNILVNSMTSSQGMVIVGIKNTDGSGIYCQTGWTVSGGSDFNHDGIPDVVIGAPYFNQPSQYISGSGYVIFGPGSSSQLFLKYLSTVLTFTTTDSPMLVSVPGDVNNDGYVDILLGSFLNGKSFVVFGSVNGIQSIANLTSTAAGTNIEISDPVADSWQGFSVSGCLGDFNGDGIADFLVGAPGSAYFVYYYPYPPDYYSLDAYQADSSAYIVFGSPDLDNINLGSLSPSTGVVLQGKSYSLTGFSVAGVGNVNANPRKLASVLVGAPLAGSAGEAYLIFGSTSSAGSLDLADTDDSSAFLTISGVAPNDYTGWAVSSAGDFNGDQVLDFLVSAPCASYAISSSSAASLVGMVYLVLGSVSLTADISLADFNASQGMTVIGSAAYDMIGISLAGIGDINGDGFADILIGAPYAKGSAGIGIVVFGSSNPSAQVFPNNLQSQGAGFVVFSPDTEDYAGFSVGAAGDVNGDGLADFILSAPGANNYAGVSYLVYGGKTLGDIDLGSFTSSQGVSITNDAYYGQVGYSVTSYTDSKGNILSLLGNNPSMQSQGSSTAYAIVPLAPPKNSTLAPTARPTMVPTLMPSAIPSLVPSHSPSLFPTLYPTMAPTSPPFWVDNQGIILGVLIPTVLSFIPIYFSKQICFHVLQHWSSANRRRGILQIGAYTACKRVFLEDFVEAMETKERKKELDEREALTAKNPSVELAVLSRMKARSSQAPADMVDNPLLRAEEGTGGLGQGQGQGQPQQFVNRLESNEPASFRQSAVDIDSDDEDEDDRGLRASFAGGQSAPPLDPLSGGRDQEVRAVYSLRFDDPQIDALYRGRLLLLGDRGLVELVEKAAATANQPTEIAPVKPPASPGDSAPPTASAVWSNPLEQWPLLRHFLVVLLLPRLEFGLSLILRRPVSLQFLPALLDQRPLLLALFAVAELFGRSNRQKAEGGRRWLLRSLLRLLFFGLRLLAVDLLLAARGIGGGSTWADAAYCFGLTAVYSAHRLAVCGLAAWPFSSSLCLQVDLPIRAVTAGSECFLLAHQLPALSSAPGGLSLLAAVAVLGLGWRRGLRSWRLLSAVVLADHTACLLAVALSAVAGRLSLGSWLVAAMEGGTETMLDSLRHSL